MILIYSNNESNRLNYTLNVIFKYVLKVEYSLVDINTFNDNTTLLKINYSTKKIKNCISITPHTLLFEKDIKEHNIVVDWTDKTPYFFNKDIFASTFFMISRYEEYLPNELDTHNRFKAENSIAYKHNFLELPIVNLWALELKKELLKLQPDFIFPKTKYKFINSLDIDIAYSYKGKSTLRLISSTLKTILTLNRADFKHRFNYFIKNQQDPYDVYKKIDALKSKYNTYNLYFFLLGNYSSYDKNLSHNSEPYRKLINKISDDNDIGIHPSYLSNLNKSQLKAEIDRLNKICNKVTKKSRQHFLKLSMPETYESLISCGVNEDYTMGYASQIGFRAGICCKYPFFNIINDNERNLILIPFQIMDGTLNEYLELSPTEAIVKIKKIVTEVKQVNGTFVSLWHNSSLSEHHRWKNWTKAYEALLVFAKEEK